MANLFTSQTPDSLDNSDGAPGITFATTVVFAVDGTVTGVRFFATTTVSGTYTGAIWTVDANDPGTGTALATKTLGVAPTGGAWNTITFDSPVSVTAGTAYRVGVFSGAGRYVATLSFFGSPLTNGDITAPAHNGTAGGFTVSQGTFRIDGSIGYPNSPGGGGTNYFADVEFSLDATPIAVGDTGSVVSSLASQATVPAADAGSAADVVAATASAPTAESATASDTATVAVTVALADAGSSEQALTVAVVAALADAGAAVDAGDGDDGSAVPKSAGDTGSAVERLRTTTVRPNSGTTIRPFTGTTLRP